MDLSEEYTQYCIGWVLKEHSDDLEELNKFTSKGIIDKLTEFISKPYMRTTYDTAISIIEDNAEEIKKIYKLKDMKS
jgi:aspartyl/asparaginyl-tRNA synthetase